MGFVPVPQNGTVCGCAERTKDEIEKTPITFTSMEKPSLLSPIFFQFRLASPAYSGQALLVIGPSFFGSPVAHSSSVEETTVQKVQFAGGSPASRQCPLLPDRTALLGRAVAFWFADVWHVVVLVDLSQCRL